MRFFVLFCASICACASGGSTSDPIRGDAGIDAAPRDAADAGRDSAVRLDAAADAAPLCEPLGCSPFDDDACGAGEGCQPADGGWACRALSETVAGAGASCVQDRDCAHGLLCFGNAPDAVCRQLCQAGSVGQCGQQARCTGAFGDDCVRTCRPRPAPCDIYAQDCVDASLACTFALDGETGAPYTACRMPGTRASGESCGDDDGACVRGYVCIRSDDDTSACRQVCDPDGSPACASPSESCTGFADTWSTGYCKPVL